MGLAFADQIRSGENGKLIINQLVGNSSEALALSGLDQNTSYDFLDGQTPGQALQQINARNVPETLTEANKKTRAAAWVALKAFRDKVK